MQFSYNYKMTETLTNDRAGEDGTILQWLLFTSLQITQSTIMNIIMSFKSVLLKQSFIRDNLQGYQ